MALSEVAEWADLAPDAHFEGLDRPSFAYFRIPSANREDRHSPLGVSVYAPAVDTIRDADTQYGRLILSLIHIYPYPDPLQRCQSAGGNRHPGPGRHAQPGGGV